MKTLSVTYREKMSKDTERVCTTWKVNATSENVLFARIKKDIDGYIKSKSNGYKIFLFGEVDIVILDDVTAELIANGTISCDVFSGRTNIQLKMY